MYPVEGKIAFVILLYLIFFSWQVKANSLQKEVSQVEYQGYLEWEGKEYQQFLPPEPEGMWYYTKMKGIGNVDNTPEKEEVVLITVQHQIGAEYVEQAFLLVCTKAEGVLKKKGLLKLYDYGAEETSFQGAYPSLVFRKTTWKFMPNNGRLKLVDLNGDGMLDVFVELWFSGGSYGPYYIAVVSFQNGKLKQIFNSFAGANASSPFPPQYIDVDKDGIYEIEIPNEIVVEGVPHSSMPTWINLYEWNGEKYVLNNQKFYSRDTSILFSFVETYLHELTPTREPGRYFEEYEFYLGLIYYYQGSPYAHTYLGRIVEKAKNENYIKEAQAVLKRLQEAENPDFAPRKMK